MKIKKFNEGVNEELIEIIDDHTFDDLADRTIDYSFDKIKDILKEQTKKLLFHFYNNFLFTEIDGGGVQSYFREIYLYIDLFAIHDDYFICEFTNEGYQMFLKIDSIDGINILADFIIKNENELI